ncbi:MAG: hybrid sensor histidine kinase/response regulator [Desulfarculaceae bacterium]|nr:hybrid sensor histidine kinase/response regulator [Desulfarculaceae bacterium]
MSSADDFRRQLMETFQVELQEHIEVLTDGCLALEKSPSAQEVASRIEGMFRAAHSLKGAARAVELEDLGLIAHRLEDVFSAIRRGEMEFSQELGDLCLHTLDFLNQASQAHQQGTSLPSGSLRALLAQLERAAQGQPFTPPQPPAAAPPEAPAEPAPAAPPSSEQPMEADACAPPAETAAEAAPAGGTIRVKVSKIDALMEGMVELLVARMRPVHRLDELGLMRKKLAAWETGWRQMRATVNQIRRREANDPQIMSLVNYLMESEHSLRELNDAAGRIAHGMAADIRQLVLLTDEMQVGVHRVRMRPLSNLFSLFPRMVRDLARDAGKRVELVLRGQDTEVDRQVLEAMKAPLTHLLRNAVDHGIEAPAQRVAAGKTSHGTITLSASQQGGMVVLEVSDDGVGVDLEQVRREASTRGIALDGREEAHEIHQLLFISGFSTKDQVSQVSGRGVGLDAVKAGVEALQGMVTLESTPGRGSRFTMHLPLTMATTNTLLLTVAGVTVAVPATAVERIHQVPLEKIGSVEGRTVVELGGRAMPLVSMAGVLGLEQEPEPGGDGVLVVVMGLAERRCAFMVDALRGIQEVVVKNLGRQLKSVPNVDGAAVLGSGEVIVVLNVADLLASSRQTATRAPAPASAPQAAAPLILVADDSITTRTLEKNILETAGYRVEVSSDGEEAWTQLQRGGFALVVSDVDMPRLDGCGLAERLKKDERFRDVPVVLVTSLDSEDDKLRGMQSGADAYITKGEFDQGNLLSTIERLIG